MGESYNLHDPSNFLTIIKREKGIYKIYGAAVYCNCNSLELGELFSRPKGAVTLRNFSCNLFHNFVVTQVVIKDTETATCHMLLLLQALQKVELDSTFHNNCGNNFINFFNIAQCNTPCNLSQCLARSANQDPY